MKGISYKKLFKLLEENNITRTQLVKMAGISTNMMAKLGKNESVHLVVLYKICCELNCTLSEIVDFYYPSQAQKRGKNAKKDD